MLASCSPPVTWADSSMPCWPTATSTPAWEAATAASDDLGDSRWALLAEAHEPSDPGAAFEVYLRLAESTLLSANRQAYQKAAKRLKAARRAAATAERSGEFDDRLSTLREQYHRRPTLITILDKAGLVP